MTNTSPDSDIRARLQEVFRSVFGEPNLQLIDTLTATDIQAWDSLAHITLVLAVEKEFRVKLTAAEVAHLQNVGAFVRLIVDRNGSP